MLLMNCAAGRRSMMLVSCSSRRYEGIDRLSYKYRMAIASKGKGKSGGARVITYNVQQKNADEVLVTLMAIYDKSDIENVSDAYLRSLVQQIETDGSR